MAAIVIPEFMDENAIHEILADFEVLYDARLIDRPSELFAALQDARALIVRNRTQVRGRLLDTAPKLEVVGRLGVGLDNIDIAQCQARRIAVYPATGANETAVAEYVIAAALMLLRGAYQASTDVIAGTWPRMVLTGREIAGKRLGLIGFGANARQTARRALALGMAVSACDPHVPAGDPAWRPPGGMVMREEMADILALCDVVSIHVPLTAETRNLIGVEAFASMKKGAVLINAARGGVVDEDALVHALKSGQLGGAMLDVFAEEPLSAARGAVFARCPNLILTPHIAGVTVESNVRISRVTAENVRRHLMKG